MGNYYTRLEERLDALTDQVQALREKIETIEEKTKTIVSLYETFGNALTVQKNALHTYTSTVEQSKKNMDTFYETQLVVYQQIDELQDILHESTEALEAFTNICRSIEE